MFDKVTSQRLERLERETSRRQWDSTVMTAAQRGQLEPATGAPQVAVTGGDKPLVDLMAERFDRLERKNERMEWQIDRLEQRTLFWKRAFAASLLLVMLLLAGGLGAVSFVTASMAAASRQPPKSVKTPVVPLDSGLNNKEAASQPWVIP